MKKFSRYLNEDAPTNNISSGAISNPQNKLLGRDNKTLYRKNNEKVGNELLKKWLRGK